MHSKAEKEVNFGLKPSQGLLDSWQQWMALEAVSQLRSRRVNIEIEPEIIDSLINLKSFNSLALWPNFTERLAIERLAIEKKPPTQNKFIRLVKNLERDFSHTIEKIPILVQHLGRNHCVYLQEYIDEDLQHLSPDSKKDLLKSITKVLLLQRQNLEHEISLLTRKIQSVRISFNTLMAKNFSLNAASVWKSLVLFFKFRYEKELNGALNQLIFELMQTAQKSYQHASKSASFLLKVENSLACKCSYNLVSLPVFFYQEYLAIDLLQKKLDSWLECTISFWDNKTSVTNFEAKILANFEKMAVNLFYNFQYEFLKSSITKD